MKAAVLTRAACAAAAFFLFGQALPGQTLLLDFGNSNPLTSTGAGTNPAGLVGTWTTIIGDTSAGSGSGIVDSSGNALGNVSVDLGAVNVGGGYLTMSVNSYTSLTEATGTTIFAAGTPASNSMFDGSGAGIAANIGGLAAGTYQVFVVADRAKTSTIAETVYAGAVASGSAPGWNSATNYNLGATGPQTNSLNLGSASESNSASTSWIQNTNYVSFFVTIGAGDNLVVATSGSNTSPLNMIEIVAVPEPSTAALLGAGALGLGFLAWRRRAALA